MQYREMGRSGGPWTPLLRGEVVGRAPPDPLQAAQLLGQARPSLRRERAAELFLELRAVVDVNQHDPRRTLGVGA
jgi:hypothetical protein